MLPSTGLRSPLFALAVTAGFVLVFTFGFLAWQSPERIPFPRSSGHYSMLRRGSSHDNSATASISEIIRLLFSPLKVAPDAAFMAMEDGSHLDLPPNPRYKKKLGKDVLILDLETRSLASNKAYDNGTYNWRSINHVSGGIFDHYTYALIHGYDYKFIHAQQFDDRHATWIKPSALANQLNDYKWIVFLDADATFRFFNLPLEWMLNYWDIQPQHSLTMALDPWDPQYPNGNADRFNRTLTNTGFIIVQKNDVTMDILKAWHECPDDVRYPGCSEWKAPRFHEQSAMGNYIRYDYEDNIKELPCAEANGFPGVQISNCQGQFVRHYWFEKSLVKSIFQDNIMQAVTLPIQRLFAENNSRIIEYTQENVIHGM